MYGNKSYMFTTEQILLDVKEQKTTPGHTFLSLLFNHCHWFPVSNFHMSKKQII